VETLQDSIEVNKLDIALPQGELMLRKKKEKTRQEQLGLGRPQKPSRPRSCCWHTMDNRS